MIKIGSGSCTTAKNAEPTVDFSCVKTKDKSMMTMEFLLVKLDEDNT